MWGGGERLAHIFITLTALARLPSPVAWFVLTVKILYREFTVCTDEYSKLMPSGAVAPTLVQRAVARVLMQCAGALMLMSCAVADVSCIATASVLLHWCWCNVRSALLWCLLHHLHTR